MSDDSRYYTILGLNENASQIEIKNAYKNLTKFYHPDIKETGSTEKMQEINIAYNALFNQELYNQEIEELKKDPEKYKQIRANFPIVFEEEKEEEELTNKNDNNNNSEKKTKIDSNYNKSHIAISCCIGVIILPTLIIIEPILAVIVFALAIFWGLYKTKLN